MTRLLVTGDRHWGKGKHADEDYDMLTYALYDLTVYWGVTDLVEGEAPGADLMSRVWALDNPDYFIRVHPYYAQWDKYRPTVQGKKNPAGAIRNRRMLKGEPCDLSHPQSIIEHEDAPPDIVAAFHRNLNQSKGTADMVKIAREAGIPVFVFPHVANI